MEKRDILYPGKFYHIYNRGINRGKIFYNDQNYDYFLKKFDHYLSDFLDLYSYCLLPNHFHFLVRIKDEEDINLKNPPGFKNLEGLYSTFNHPISQSFSNLFNSYAKALNKQQDRTGSLFQKNFKRKLINKENYLLQIIYYIHFNPVHHQFIDSYEGYKYSSYKFLLSEKKSKLKRDNIFKIFKGKENFVNFHKSRLKEIEEIKEFYLE